MKMILLELYVYLILLFFIANSAHSPKPLLLDHSNPGPPMEDLGYISEESSYRKLKDVIQPDDNQEESSLGRESETKITMEDLLKSEERIKKTMIRLYQNTLQELDRDIYLTKVGVSKPIITDSSIEIESLESRKRNKVISRDCLEVLRNGNNVSGVYQIQPDRSKKPFMVLCDMDIRGGGWTHIHKRFDGSVDFYRGWREYKIGFGDLLGEFWIGLEHIHWLTSSTHTKLLIEIVDRDNVTRYAEYNAFGIGPEPDGYGLDILSDYSGDAGDSLAIHRGMKFSTKDLDQDNYEESCAQMYSGAWWYNKCFYSNLNGEFINVHRNISFPDNYKGMHWKTFRGWDYSHAKARMLVKPAIDE